MKAKVSLAILVALAFSPVIKADFTIDVTSVDVNSIQSFGGSPPILSPTGDYFVAPTLGNAGSLFFASGAIPGNSTFNDATEVIGGDLLGGSIESSDLTTPGPSGTSNTLITISSTGGDLAPAGFADGAGIALDTLGVIYGDFGAGASPPIDFGSGLVNTAFFDVTDVAGASLIGGPIDLIAAGFDVQSGTFLVSVGAGSAGIGAANITLDVNVTKAIPEPTSLVVLSVLGMGLVARRRR